MKAAILRLAERPFTSMSITDRALAFLQAGFSVFEYSDLGSAIWRLLNKHPEKEQELGIELNTDSNDRRGWYYRLE